MGIIVPNKSQVPISPSLSSEYSIMVYMAKVSSISSCYFRLAQDYHLGLKNAYWIGKVHNNKAPSGPKSEQLDGCDSSTIIFLRHLV